jgi:hypothetical protein
MRSRVLLVLAAIGIITAASGTVWIASPTKDDLELSPPLEAWTSDRVAIDGDFDKDLSTLTSGFQAQIYRSFCGPASIATVLGAYGVKNADQAGLFPTLQSKLDAFYTGMSLAELAALAESSGLQTEVVYADTLNVDTFRERLKTNLATQGDFVVVNYDRRVLNQSGAGHISPIGAYDESRDAFLVLDAAAYRYPFTWVPTRLLYQAVHTRADDGFRGVLFISAYRPPAARDADRE